MSSKRQGGNPFQPKPLALADRLEALRGVVVLIIHDPLMAILGAGAGGRRTSCRRGELVMDQRESADGND